jgi:hypothetical protein
LCDLMCLIFDDSATVRTDDSDALLFVFTEALKITERSLVRFERVRGAFQQCSAIEAWDCHTPHAPLILTEAVTEVAIIFS